MRKISLPRKFGTTPWRHEQALTGIHCRTGPMAEERHCHAHYYGGTCAGVWCLWGGTHPTSCGGGNLHRPWAARLSIPLFRCILHCILPLTLRHFPVLQQGIATVGCTRRAQLHICDWATRGYFKSYHTKYMELVPPFQDRPPFQNRRQTSFSLPPHYLPFLPPRDSDPLFLMLPQNLSIFSPHPSMGAVHSWGELWADGIDRHKTSTITLGRARLDGGPGGMWKDIYSIPGGLPSRACRQAHVGVPLCRSPCLGGRASNLKTCASPQALPRLLAISPFCARTLTGACGTRRAPRGALRALCVSISPGWRPL